MSELLWVKPGWRRLTVAGLLPGLLLLLLVMMVQAQGNQPLWVYIHETYVDKTGPQVAAGVTVRGPDGLPVRDLTMENFRIQEAGEPFTAPLAVKETRDQPLQLVLVIDLSMHFRKDLEGVKVAALALIERLQPEDHLTVITFYNQLHEPDDPLFKGYLQDTDRRQKLIQDIVKLEATGDRTALFQVTRWGVEQLDSTDPNFLGRQGVVILTNLGNNIDMRKDIAAQEFLETYWSRVGPEMIPVHIISFGDKAKQDQLSELSQRTFGQHIHVATDDEMAEETRELVARLRPGYEATFVPRRGHDRDRKFSVRVTVADLEATAIAGYQLEPADGQITLFGVQDLPLGQSRKITAVVNSTYPVESVSYQVNQGQPEESLPPSYAYLLGGNTTGVYTLTATLTDRLGNRWQQQVPYKVLPGVDVFEIVETRFADPLRLELVVDQPLRIRRVEVELQQKDHIKTQVITPTAETPVYLVLRSGDPTYPPEPGQYLYRLKIIGENEVPAEERFFVRFLSPPSAPGFSRPLLSAIILILAHLLLAWLLYVWIRNRYAALARQIRPLGLKIFNRGNVPTAFHLAAKATAAVKPVALQVVGDSLPQPEPEQGPRKKSQYGHGQGRDNVTDQKTGSNEAEAVVPDQPPTDSSQPYLQLGRLIDWLLPVPGLFSRLPLLGRPFRNLQQYLRRGQSLSRRAGAGSTWLGRRFSRRAAARPESPDTTRPETTSVSLSADSSSANQEQAASTSADQISRRPASATYPTAWQSPLRFDTPPIPQGRTAEIALRVRSLGEARQRQCYEVQFETRPVDPAGTPDQKVLRRQTAEIELEGLPGLYRHFWPLALGLVSGLIVADLIWYWFWYQLYGP